MTTEEAYECFKNVSGKGLRLFKSIHAMAKANYPELFRQERKGG